MSRDDVIVLTKRPAATSKATLPSRRSSLEPSRAESAAQCHGSSTYRTEAGDGLLPAIRSIVCPSRRPPGDDLAAGAPLSRRPAEPYRLELDERGVLVGARDVGGLVWQRWRAACRPPCRAIAVTLVIARHRLCSVCDIVALLVVCHLVADWLRAASVVTYCRRDRRSLIDFALYACDVPVATWHERDSMYDVVSDE